MLGRKDYTQEELGNGRKLLKEQLSAYKKIAKASDAGVETTHFNSALLALDRLSVHRLRTVTGKDTNPLNEDEPMAESLQLFGPFADSRGSRELSGHVPAAVIPRSAQLSRHQWAGVVRSFGMMAR